MKEKALAFAWGSLLAIIDNIGEEVVRTLFFGLLGGIAGIAGRDIYLFIKHKTWRRQR